MEEAIDITYQPFFESDGAVAGVLSISVEVTDSASGREQLQQETRNRCTGSS